jgi:hypothetical protein
LDSFYGGRQDLAAALGFERDGQTIIFFRCKLNSSDEVDHIIGSEPMQVIWARGQEHGKYVHRPKWKYPVSCDPFEMDCNYYAKWEYLELSDHIYFTITANHTNRWVAIGFSETTSMVLFSSFTKCSACSPPTTNYFHVVCCLVCLLDYFSLKRTWCSVGSTQMAAPLLATCGPYYGIRLLFSPTLMGFNQFE